MASNGMDTPTMETKDQPNSNAPLTPPDLALGLSPVRGVAAKKSPSPLFAQLNAALKENARMAEVAQEVTPILTEALLAAYQTLEGLHLELAQAEAQNEVLQAELTRIRKDASMKPPHEWEQEREEALEVARIAAEERMRTELATAELRRVTDVTKVEQERDARVAELNAAMADQAQKMMEARMAEIAVLRHEWSSQVAKINAERRKELADARGETRRQVAKLKGELLAHIAKVVGEMAHISRVWQGAVVQRLENIVSDIDESKFIGAARPEGGANGGGLIVVHGAGGAAAALASPRTPAEPKPGESTPQAGAEKRRLEQADGDNQEGAKRPARSGEPEGMASTASGGMPSEQDDVYMEEVEEAESDEDSGALRQEVQIKCYRSGTREATFGTFVYWKRANGDVVQCKVLCKCEQCAQAPRPGGPAFSPAAFEKHAGNASRKWKDSIAQANDTGSIRSLLGDMPKASERAGKKFMPLDA